MITPPIENSSSPFLFQLDKKNPLRFAWACLIFIYLLQYPLSQLLLGAIAIPQYDLGDWLFAYGFILFSVAIFMPALFVGLSGRPVKIYPIIKHRWKPKKCISMRWVIVVFALFGFWSYLMVNLKIGMTIYAGFDPLPYRITGFLFYGRLFVQPMMLASIAAGYANSKLKWILFLLLAALGFWVSLTSGSRFAAIIFALPMLLLFNGKSRYLAFGVTLLCSITIASLSRHFYLPFIIGGEYIQIYANEEYQALATENIYLLPFFYAISRPMGMAEVLMTLKYGDIAPSFVDSLQSFLAYFLPYVSLGNSASIKHIYGLSDDAFGGLGLDMFSNFWVAFGGSPLLYLLGLALIGWLLGKSYRQFAIGLARFGLREPTFLVFILLFILIFEARGFLFPGLLLVGWLFSKKSTPRIAFAMLGSSSPKRTLLPSQSLQSYPRT